MLGQEDDLSWAGVWVLVVLLAAVMVGSGILIIVVARRAADGRTGVNKVAGIRTAATMSSDEAWLAAHVAGRRLTELGGRIAVIGGLASIPAAGVVAAAGGSRDATVLAAVGLSIGLGSVGVLVCVIAGAVVGHRAAVVVRDGFGS
ncbi:MAG: SdpI family protein [Actinomycetota bacterium]